MGEEREVYGVLVGKLEGKRPLGRPRRRWVDTHTHTHTHIYIYIHTYSVYTKEFLLYGCETWSLTLREERKLRVFMNKVLRRIFGPWRDEVTGEWRRLHNEELNDLYCSPNIVRVIKC